MTQPSVFARLAGALVLFFSLDGLLFRSGYYASILEPNSMAGYLQSHLLIEVRRPAAETRDVVAVGDSRIGLKPRVADAAGTGYRFFTIAVPGTSPRCWYYMLREADPAARRYAAIVIPFDTYDDRLHEDYRRREQDMRYLVPLLRYGDLFEFALSYPGWAARVRAAAPVLFKGFLYREDFQDFLVHHRRRLQVARELNSRRSGWRYDAVWDSASLDGLSVDWAQRAVHLPESLTAAKRKEAMDVLLMDPALPNPAAEQYRREWFGRIVERYRGSRTRLIFVRLPRGPVVRPGLASDTRSSIRDFAARGDTVMIDEHHFDSLERPQLFGDALHLNEQGAVEFSGMLAREVARILDGGRR